MSGNNGTEQIVLARTAFGRESCVKIECNGRGTWLHVGKKSNGAWDWEKAKLSDTEIAEMLLVLDRAQEQASWFHKFEGKETKINVTRKESTVFVRVNEFAAALKPGQQVVFAHLCSRILERGCEQEPWQREEAPMELRRGDQ